MTEQKYYVLDGILDSRELLWIYHELIASSGWTLARTSKNPGLAAMPFMSFPGLHIRTREVVEHPFLDGYFTGLTFRIRARLRKEFGLQLPDPILRIHVGAKSSFSRTEPHRDSADKTHWTILGFLNPVWNARDGGEFFIEEEKIEYRSGRFVVFPSHLMHDGGFVRNETLNYWRIAVNIILGELSDATSSSD